MLRKLRNCQKQSDQSISRHPVCVLYLCVLIQWLLFCVCYVQVCLLCVYYSVFIYYLFVLVIFNYFFVVRVITFVFIHIYYGLHAFCLLALFVLGNVCLCFLVFVMHVVSFIGVCIVYVLFMCCVVSIPYLFCNSSVFSVCM